MVLLELVGAEVTLQPKRIEKAKTKPGRLFGCTIVESFLVKEGRSQIQLSRTGSLDCRPGIRQKWRELLVDQTRQALHLMRTAGLIYEPSQ